MYHTYNDGRRSTGSARRRRSTTRLTGSKRPTQIVSAAQTAVGQMEMQCSRDQHDDVLAHAYEAQQALQQEPDTKSIFTAASAAEAGRCAAYVPNRTIAQFFNLQSFFPDLSIDVLSAPDDGTWIYPAGGRGAPKDSRTTECMYYDGWIKGGCTVSDDALDLIVNHIATQDEKEIIPGLAVRSLLYQAGRRTRMFDLAQFAAVGGRLDQAMIAAYQIYELSYGDLLAAVYAVHSVRRRGLETYKIYRYLDDMFLHRVPFAKRIEQIDAILQDTEAEMRASMPPDDLHPAKRGRFSFSAAGIFAMIQLLTVVQAASAAVGLAAETDVAIYKPKSIWMPSATTTAAVATAPRQLNVAQLMARPDQNGSSIQVPVIAPDNIHAIGTLRIDRSGKQIVFTPQPLNDIPGVFTAMNVLCQRTSSVNNPTEYAFMTAALRARNVLQGDNHDEATIRATALGMCNAGSMFEREVLAMQAIDGDRAADLHTYVERATQPWVESKVATFAPFLEGGDELTNQFVARSFVSLLGHHDPYARVLFQLTKNVYQGVGQGAVTDAFIATLTNIVTQIQQYDPSLGAPDMTNELDNVRMLRLTPAFWKDRLTSRIASILQIVLASDGGPALLEQVGRGEFEKNYLSGVQNLDVVTSMKQNIQQRYSATTPDARVDMIFRFTRVFLQEELATTGWLARPFSIYTRGSLMTAYTKATDFLGETAGVTLQRFMSDHLTHARYDTLVSDMRRGKHNNFLVEWAIGTYSTDGNLIMSTMWQLPSMSALAAPAVMLTGSVLKLLKYGMATFANTLSGLCGRGVARGGGGGAATTNANTGATNANTVNVADGAVNVQSGGIVHIHNNNAPAPAPAPALEPAPAALQAVAMPAAHQMPLPGAPVQDGIWRPLAAGECVYFVRQNIYNRQHVLHGKMVVKTIVANGAAAGSHKMYPLDMGTDGRLYVNTSAAHERAFGPRRTHLVKLGRIPIGGDANDIRYHNVLRTRRQELVDALGGEPEVVNWPPIEHANHQPCGDADNLNVV